MNEIQVKISNSEHSLVRRLHRRSNRSHMNFLELFEKLSRIPITPPVRLTNFSSVFHKNFTKIHNFGGQTTSYDYNHLYNIP